MQTTDAVNHQPKVSVFHDLGMRLNNQISFSRIAPPLMQFKMRLRPHRNKFSTLNCVSLTTVASETLLMVYESIEPSRSQNATYPRPVESRHNVTPQLTAADG